MAIQTGLCLVLSGLAGLSVEGLTSNAWVAQNATCTEPLKSHFQPDEGTTVVTVSSFSKGETPSPVAFAPGVAAEDLCMVRLPVPPIRLVGSPDRCFRGHPADCP